MRKLVLTLVMAAVMMTTSAMAIPLNGSISFVGNASYIGGNTAATATGIHFLPAFGGMFPAELVGAATGNYSNLVKSDAFFHDIVFNQLPASPLWTVTQNSITYNFILTSLTHTVTGNHLTLNGSGFLGATGFDSTAGMWSFSIDDNPLDSNLTFSAVSAVPEPGTMVLLGIGMLGLAIYGKRRMNKVV